MQSRKIRMLTETVDSLLQRGARTNLQKLLSKSHAADLSIVFRSLSGSETRATFALIDDVEKKAEVISHLDSELQGRLLPTIEMDELVAIFSEMSNDVAADAMGLLPEELASELLSRMARTDSLQVEDLMEYDPDTAGGIMSPEFVSLSEDTTVQKAAEVLRASDDVAMAFYVYVTNEFEQLCGVISLRQLVTSAADRSLKELMETNVMRVRWDTDQEDVARLVARYNFLAIPVVDDGNKLIGIVTVDDVIDVIREEATEDILKMAGAGQDLEELRSVPSRVASRIRPLGYLFLSGAIAVPLLHGFRDMFNSNLALIYFIPLLLGLGSTAAIQATTYMSRGWTMGVIRSRWVRRQIRRELYTSAVLGVAYGLGCGLLAVLISGWALGLVVASAVGLGMVVSTLIGAALPLFFVRFKIDPSLATHPMVRMLSMVAVLIVYLLVSSTLLWCRLGG